MTLTQRVLLIILKEEFSLTVTVSVFIENNHQSVISRDLDAYHKIGYY